ncbi:19835_t:CDS:2, partial [Racocetra persica]
LKNLEYEYNFVERSLKNILEQLEKEKKINFEVRKTVEILDQKADIILMNYSSEKIKEIKKLIDKLRNKNQFFSKKKDECEKKDLDNQLIINENKNLKEQNFENKILEIKVEINSERRVLNGFIKNNNLELEKELIDKSLNNFKIPYNITDSLESKMDLLIEI